MCVSSTDPFNRQPLEIADLVPDAELRSRIQQFRQNAKQKKGTQMDDTTTRGTVMIDTTPRDGDNNNNNSNGSIVSTLHRPAPDDVD